MWARLVIWAYDYWMADTVIAEINQGGDMVKTTLRTVRDSLPIEEVRAYRGKQVRAAPVSAIYEQGRIHHVINPPEIPEELLPAQDQLSDAELNTAAAEALEASLGPFGKLEDQLINWQPGSKKSPDRLDSLVYGATDCLVVSEIQEELPDMAVLS